MLHETQEVEYTLVNGRYIYEQTDTIRRTRSTVGLHPTPDYEIK